MTAEAEIPLPAPLPAPLVPPDVDLRGYDFMPLYGEFLRRSDFNCRVSDSEFRAAVMLWWSSWWQVPAATLPNDDRQLCKLADLQSLRKWRLVKTQALSGFVLCSDNRWHHSFLSVIARDVYSKKKSATLKGVLGAKKRWENNGNTHATGNGSGNATASGLNGGKPVPQPSESDSSGNATGYGNRSKGISPLTPRAESAGTATHRLPARWWLSDQGMNAAGRQLGIGEARIGESREAFKRRIELEIARRERGDAPPNPREDHHDPGLETLDT